MKSISSTMPTRTLKGKYCNSICRVEALCMLSREKRHSPRNVKPHRKRSSVQEASGTQSGILYAPRDISRYSWKPNKSPNTSHPERKTTGRMKKGRLGSASCLVWLFRLIPSFVVHCRSMRRSIHLLDGEILRVQFIS